MPTPTKRCPECGVVKDRAADFSRGAAYCRPCTSARAMRKYWANAAYREERKAWHKENERQKRRDPVWNGKRLAALREKRRTNPEWRAKTLAAVNARRMLFVGRALAIGARKRAKERGMVCTITSEWTQRLFDARPYCTYCNRMIRSASGNIAPDSATLDRVDTVRGYTPENTVLACFRCNTLKRDSTPEELEMLAANIRRVMTSGSEHH